MFCSSCGENCPLEAISCHKYGDRLKQNVTEGAGSAHEDSKKDESGGSASATGGGSGASGFLTLPSFEPQRKRVDRSTLGKNLEIK